ncbi:MAG TPA: 2,3-diphosphoglycerate-dependent phosphoglycerate mutase [Acidimicrobiales bacterium]
MPTLILLRHGQSEWNLSNQFTGWWDSDLTEFGRAEAAEAGQLLLDAALLPDVCHTSLQKRAIRTAFITLDVVDRLWIPQRRSWRLNERHYGGLTGLDKAETRAKHGDTQLKLWRRSYDVRPPDIDDANPHNPNRLPMYAHLPPEIIPKSECLKDVVARMLPYWYDAIVPDLQAGKVVLVAAHGNSLRALVKHLNDIGDSEIAELDIPTGKPIVYELGDDMRPVEAKPVSERYLGDPEAIRAAAEAVKRQAG